MPASSSLNKEIRTILSRWSRAGYYVYLRPLTSKYIDARSDHTVYWVVQVELRDTPPGQWRAEGSNLDQCILELDAKVPHSRKVHHKRTAGWMAPKKVEKKEQERFRKETKERAEAQFAKSKKKSKKRPVDELAARRKKKKVKT